MARDAVLAMGDGWNPDLSGDELEMDSRQVSRKSIFTGVGIGAGEVVTREMLKMMRPGTGIPPTRMAEVVGKVAIEDIPAKKMITMEMLGEGET